MTLHFSRDPREMAAAEIWAEIEADPDAVAAIQEGLADLAAGRVVPFADIQTADSDDGSVTHEEHPA